ncbi:MAG: AbrB/MazE/SpoVT family DNA-binding domain-containing protein [Caulobacter sp.]|nr:AbrB/MazE/SpoVT family DNA-binding domain-containing protein [Caulobacter sp.]
MTTVTSKTFRSGNSQAVRLPRKIAYDDGIELTIVRSGDVITICPKRPSVAEMIAKLDALPKPPSIQERDSDIFADRPGL